MGRAATTAAGLYGAHTLDPAQGRGSARGTRRKSGEGRAGTRARRADLNPPPPALFYLHPCMDMMSPRLPTLPRTLVSIPSASPSLPSHRSSLHASTTPGHSPPRLRPRHRAPRTRPPPAKAAPAQRWRAQDSSAPSAAPTHLDWPRSDLLSPVAERVQIAGHRPRSHALSSQVPPRIPLSSARSHHRSFIFVFHSPWRLTCHRERRHLPAFPLSSPVPDSPSPFPALSRRVRPLSIACPSRSTTPSLPFLAPDSKLVAHSTSPSVWGVHLLLPTRPIQ